MTRRRLPLVTIALSIVVLAVVATGVTYGFANHRWTEHAEPGDVALRLHVPTINDGEYRRGGADWWRPKVINNTDTTFRGMRFTITMRQIGVDSPEIDIDDADAGPACDATTATVARCEADIKPGTNKFDFDLDPKSTPTEGARFGFRGELSHGGRILDEAVQKMTVVGVSETERVTINGIPGKVDGRRGRDEAYRWSFNLTNRTGSAQDGVAITVSVRARSSGDGLAIEPIPTLYASTWSPDGNGYRTGTNMMEDETLTYDLKLYTDDTYAGGDGRPPAETVAFDVTVSASRNGKSFGDETVTVVIT